MRLALELILPILLIVCALAVTFSKRLLVAVVIFTSFSLIMSVIWVLLESPDLAITEAAVGAGITSILFFLTLKKLHALKGTRDE
mgnify:CR=1 FL=1